MKELKPRITENGIEYVLVGDYYIPDLKLPEERFTCIVDQMKAAEGVTEELKRKDAMLWVQRCNNIRNRAEEIVLNEMVYI